MNDINDITDINNYKFIKIKSAKTYNSFMPNNKSNYRFQKYINKNNLKKILSLNESKYNTNDTTENLSRHDAKGVPLFKGNSKNYHVYFIDEISNNKLVNVENIESYKKYNAENLSMLYDFKEKKNKNYLSCCCLIF